MKAEIFDAASLQLQRGRNLVEASAGTGKTFAIAMLVLRFLTEEKGAGNQAIPLEKILIVTFTKAATKELRQRIRSRLVEARNILEGWEDEEKKRGFDLPLRKWAENIVAEGRQQRVDLLLRKALCDIDQAPIFTIHGFCQRMLGEQALESSQAFDCELLSDIDTLRLDIARDYWRDLFYHGDGGVESLLLVDKRFASPEKLLQSLDKVSEGSHFVPCGDFDEKISCYKKSLAWHLENIRCWFSANGETFFTKLCEAEESGYLNKNKSFIRKWREWWQELTTWCRSDQSRTFFSYPEWLAKETFIEGGFLRKDHLSFVDDWPFYLKAQEFLQQCEKFRSIHRFHFASFLQQETVLRLTRNGYMSQNSSIIHLSTALKKKESAWLRATLANRFDVALIDEFQDTDSLQYHIFSSVFGRGDKYLYMIGDPKQAIYGFRGADIYSYFTARKVADRVLTLDTNYRSHPWLIEEINRLFEKRQRPFFYDEAVLPFSPVNAREKEYAELRRAAGEPASGMVYWLLPNENNKRWGKGAAQSLILQHTVAEIGRLLTGGKYAVYEAGEESAKSSKALSPQDIAVLVRSNELTAQYANALADMGIPAVINDRNSVFFSEECRELLLLLAAIIAPGNVSKVKAALALSWFGHDGKDIYAIGEDESRMGSYQLSLLEYARLWHEKSFFSMMAALLQEKQVFTRLAEGMRGERRIANLRQLLNLIEQEASSRNLSPQEVYQWLLRQYRGAGDVDGSELLLESDREAVKIVTMHSAKGLEYNVVFCVDLWGGTDRLTSEQNQILYRPDSTGDKNRDKTGLMVDLGSEDFDKHRQQAKEEVRAEDLRLLYVALTRAKLRCYLVWADVRPYGRSIDSFLSPLGYLLFPDQTAKECDYLCQREQIFSRVRGRQGVFLSELDFEPTSNILDFSSTTELKKRDLLRKDFASLWRLSSFSSLAGLSEYDGELAEESTIGRQTAEQIVVPGLPAGARFGSAVHDILENHSFSHLQNGDDQCVEWCNQITFTYGIDTDAKNLAKLIQQAVEVPLEDKENNATFSLAQLNEDSCIKEMPFHLFHKAVNTEAICQLLKDDPAVVPLREKEIEGYLTGFIDLICKWNGRYYIMDYKTNYLGNFLADYQGEGLLAAMRSHNYGLQYWLYTVALHRYLGKMVEGYKYSTHFGGVFYLFVRGMAVEQPGSGVFFSSPPVEKVLELDTLLGGI